MNPEDFRASPSGRLVRTVQNAWAFVPNPLPPQLSLEPLIGLIDQAAMQLGQLAGIGRTLTNPYLLIRPFQRKEAVASSNIEGTITSLSDLLMFEAGADEKGRPPDTREVYNYVRALEHAIRQLPKLPVSLRLIREVHDILLRNVRKHRGATVHPGDFRTEQNWIDGGTLSAARFIPPPPSEVMPALDALEKYIQQPRDPNMPPLVKLALIHYQFEAIHPFPDGNGRVGRLLLPLILVETGHLPQPLLYLSPYFERHKDAYIDSLYEVSHRGAWADWIAFFLRGVIDQCADTIRRAKLLQDLQAKYRERLQKARASALLPRLIDMVFEQPFLTIPGAAEKLEVTYRAAQQNIEKLIKAGILTDVGADMRPRFFMAREIYSIVHSDVVPELSEQPQ